MRLIISGVLFLLLVLIKDPASLRRLLATKELKRSMALFIALGVILMQVSYMSAIKFTNPGTALLLQEIGVPLVVIYSCFSQRRAPKLFEVIGLLLAAGGTFVIATQGDISSLAINPEGLFWGLLSAVAMGGYAVIPRPLVAAGGALATNAVAMLGGAIIMTPFVRPWEAAPLVTLDAWIVFGGVVIAGTMLAYVLFLQGVLEAGSVRSSFIGMFEPVSGAIIAALWLGVQFSSWDYIGGAAILAMVGLVALTSGEQDS